MREQRQDVGGCTPLEKTERTYSSYFTYTSLIQLYISTFTYVTVPLLISSHLLPGYTRVVEWVLGRPAEL